MTIDATFWVAISFFIFFGGLVYLKVPQKINSALNAKVDIIKTMTSSGTSGQEVSKIFLAMPTEFVPLSVRRPSQIMNHLQFSRKFTPVH